MIAADVIKEAQERASEWLEMAENPDQLMTAILAGEIVRMHDYIEYLERRVKHECVGKVNIN